MTKIYNIFGIIFLIIIIFDNCPSCADFPETENSKALSKSSSVIRLLIMISSW